MKKLDYLKLAIRNKLYTKRSWIITAFAVTRSKDSADYIGKLKPEPWGYSFVNESGEYEKIDDAVPNVPLFRFKDPITVDPTFVENVSDKTETCIGNVLFNFIVILSSFGRKHPFVTGTVSIGKLEDAIAIKLQDTPTSEQERNPDFYYVDEYCRFVDALQFMSTLTQVTTIASTRTTIQAPKGIKEFKKELEAKYGKEITDPVKLAEYEKDLLNFDNEYLKDDPSNNIFMSGKLKHTARKKMFLAMGAEKSFSENQKVTVITNSLEEGWPTDPVKFTAAMNGIRIGSYFRGAETVKGGVSAKYLLRAANNFKIIVPDCETKLGIRRTYNKTNLNKLVGRYIVVNGVSKLVENISEANDLIGKKLIVRSPMYCKAKGDNICKVCAGVKLAQYPTGVTIPLTEISGIILTASMKAMHVNTVTTAELILEDAFT